MLQFECKRTAVRLHLKQYSILKLQNIRTIEMGWERDRRTRRIYLDVASSDHRIQHLES
jgi:hypothetical protein